MNIPVSSVERLIASVKNTQDLLQYEFYLLSVWEESSHHQFWIETKVHHKKIFSKLMSTDNDGVVHGKSII